MKTISQISSFTYKEKKSTFIAYLCPLKGLDKFMQDIKKEHKKARHLVFCARNASLTWSQSDDGEPRGSATKPMQANIKGNDLVECAVVIIRYYGGVKLGVGPLFRAYNTATKGAIKAACLEEYK